MAGLFEVVDVVEGKQELVEAEELRLQSLNTVVELVSVETREEEFLVRVPEVGLDDLDGLLESLDVVEVDVEHSIAEGVAVTQKARDVLEQARLAKTRHSEDLHDVLLC